MNRTNFFKILVWFLKTIHDFIHRQKLVNPLHCQLFSAVWASLFLSYPFLNAQPTEEFAAMRTNMRIIRLIKT
jgi:hypothetical protein